MARNGDVGMLVRLAREDTDARQRWKAEQLTSLVWPLPRLLVEARQALPDMGAARRHCVLATQSVACAAWWLDMRDGCACMQPAINQRPRQARLSATQALRPATRLTADSAHRAGPPGRPRYGALYRPHAAHSTARRRALTHV